jgi:hypothetical protein
MRRVAASLAAGVAALALFAPSAQATFHLIQVREIFPGSAANPEAQYVELQMWRSGQNLVGGHFVRTYDANGGPIATSFFPANVANGANQSTLLLATSQAASLFGTTPDAVFEPSNKFSPVGGAVCWEAIDCVAWGSFKGSLPSPSGSPVVPAGVADGMAIRRSLVRACPTFLDAADDSDDGDADFELASPSPRPNPAPTSETPCASTGQGGSGEPVHAEDRPQTSLRRKPPKRTSDRTPTFRFGSSASGAKFECKLDRKPYRRCRSPFTAKRLVLGSHRFRVRAVDHGLVDPTPASYRFRVVAASGPRSLRR